MRFTANTIKRDIEEFKAGRVFPVLFAKDEYTPTSPEDEPDLAQGTPEDAWVYGPTTQTFRFCKVIRVKDGRLALRLPGNSAVWLPRGSVIPPSMLYTVLLLLRCERQSVGREISRARQERRKSARRAREWMIGKKFNSLVVEERIPGGPHPHVRCRCECGRSTCKGQIIARWDAVRSGRTKTCRMAREA